MYSPDLQPKLLTVLREGYSRRQFVQDSLAGVVVGIVALPLAIAFAIASGVRPEQGLVTAIVAGFLISLLSGSRVQIGGPTGAFVILVYSVVQRFGYDGLATATLLAGLLLVAMGIARLGSVIRFVPFPVTVGFTSGIAVVIAAAEVRDALGLAMDTVPASFGSKWIAYSHHLRSVNPWAVGICIASILIVHFWPRATARIPGPLVALLATTVAVRLFGLPVETIGSRFGEIHVGLPTPRFPQVDLSQISLLVSPAMSIALLAGIESLLSAVVADGMTGRRHRSNAELVAQGVANIASPLFGGIPATGAIARTATNVKNGGRTPIAGIVHALTLLVIVLAAGRWAALIPMAALAGILFVVAYNMSEWRLFQRLFRSPRSDVLVLLVTFFLTVLIDLIVAIQVGVVLAALLFMRRMAEVSQVRVITDQLSEEEAAGSDLPSLPRGVVVYEIRGSFFFGSAYKFSEIIGRWDRAPAVVILHMRDVFAIDATGIRALEETTAQLARQGTTILFAGVHTQPREIMHAVGLLERIGEDNVFDAVEDAVARAGEIVARGADPPAA